MEHKDLKYYEQELEKLSKIIDRLINVLKGSYQMEDNNIEENKEVKLGTKKLTLLDYEFDLIVENKLDLFRDFCDELVSIVSEKYGSDNHIKEAYGQLELLYEVADRLNQLLNEDKLFVKTTEGNKDVSCSSYSDLSLSEIEFLLRLKPEVIRELGYKASNAFKSIITKMHGNRQENWDAVYYHLNMMHTEVRRTEALTNLVGSF